MLATIALALVSIYRLDRRMLLVIIFFAGLALFNAYIAIWQPDNKNGVYFLAYTGFFVLLVLHRCVAVSTAKKTTNGNQAGSSSGERHPEGT